MHFGHATVCKFYADIEGNHLSTEVC